MTKEEIIEFIKENLSVEVEETGGGCPCCFGSPGVNIKLVLCEKTISQDSFYFPDKNE